ncbi:hypothetical protein NIM87_09820 [Devosia sp. XJ19-1]|uniref:Uncharacterized protein n=1 Tax=Devosia ureilytica TaxID=2952754 RepID=A0A9Q4APM9_9HYPH|nr:hypothetical protein [Devosia ureilytica]MCP8883795.1 hypothetical protein [Devosia ureilytica]MCP8887403.1 hypothetical protein [Devosia ureilytica]
MPKTKMPFPVLLALTLGPALAIGTTLWVVSDMVPTCSITEIQRLPSPDGLLDLVTFTRTCGDTPDNMQAALVPQGEQVPYEAASFVSVLAEVDLEPEWMTNAQIEINLPEDAEILRRDDTVAGVAVTYR